MRTLVTNGTVLVMDGRTPSAEALVFEGRRILGVGTAAEMKSLAGARARTVDMRGGTLMPGIIDTHPHILHFAAQKAPLVDLTDATSHDDIVERIRRRAAVTPRGQWILTTPVGEPHYFRRRSYRDLEERRLPDRHTLDRATTDHPVHIQAWGPIQPNVAAFNTAGLKAIHVSKTIPDVVCNVRFDKNLQGDLLGTVRGAVTTYSNFDPFWGQIQTKILMQCGLTAGNFGAVPPELLRDAISDYHSRGVTGAYECHVMTRSDIGTYEALRNQDGLHLRVLACLEPEAGFHHFPYDPPGLDVVRERMELGRSLTRLDDDFLRVDGLSQSVGGPCSAGHFLTYEPYPDPYGVPVYGMQSSPPENCVAFMEFCAKHRVRMNWVAGSYPEHDMIIELSRAARDQHGKHAPWIIQHVVLVNPAQVRAYRELDYRMAMNVSFGWGKGDIYAERMGSHVLRDLQPLRRLVDAGLMVSLGTDWGPLNYFEHIRLCETHEFCATGHRNNGPDQVVSRVEALAMWTREAGRMMDWDGIGTLEPGTLADMIVVDRDPLTCSLDDLPRTKVLWTVVDGNTVFSTGDLEVDA